ncbi:uncharacterized protein LOC112684783 [Sipha flava]|uniref:Uncharacterized protein LOC112684780 n=1 Tax=Sipha flava TaxID=143950 RepID=A0A8B8FNH9_9HEMI|nr:uncharacterized protein LOC112684780 [Sipha flava]XP_025412232.1 uncharacterized protein LOC112684783 [Sipha flava]
MAYCNIYHLTYKMLIDAGLPISGSTYSNYDIASTLVPSAEVSDESHGPQLQFLRFREASQKIEDFVSKVDLLQNIIEDEDIKTAYTLWNTIQDEMFDFMNKMILLTSQVDDRFIELGIQLQHISNVNSLEMKKLYLDIFNETVNAVSFSTTSYIEVFNFLQKFSFEFQKENEQIKKNDELMYESNVDLRKYTRKQIAEIYKLYIEAITTFYNSKSSHMNWLKTDIISWFDLNLSKSMFDYMGYNLFTYIITITKHINDMYKYDKTNLPKLTLEFQEYVSKSMNYIIDFMNIPLKNFVSDINDKLKKK